LLVYAFQNLFGRPSSLIGVLPNEQQVDVALLYPKPSSKGADDLDRQSLRTNDFLELGQPYLHLLIGQLVLLHALTLHLVDLLSESLEGFTLLQEDCLLLDLRYSLIVVENCPCLLEHSRHVLLSIK
jgi:hypothetical protein